jgi:hypothetical protein
MEDQELKVMKSRVLDAAKDCPTATRALKKLFPEVFEKKRYKCGTIFFKPPVDPAAMKAAFSNPEVKLLNKETLSHFFILAHAGESRKYHLINLATGFPKHFTEKDGYRQADSIVFTRHGGEGGVEIPDHYLKDLKVYESEVHHEPPKTQNPEKHPIDEDELEDLT